MASDPLQPYAGWNDVDWIRTELEKALARAAHVTPKTLQRALRRVVVDGYYGPIADREFEAMDGMRMSLARAVSIIRQAQDAELPTIHVDDPDSGYRCEGANECEHSDHADFDEDGAMFHAVPIEIDSRALVEWYFRQLVPIYGSVWL